MWVVFLAVAFLALAGLVIDGGYTMGAKREAARAAEQASRIAADQLDTDSVRTGGSKISPSAAVSAGQGYLASIGESGTVDVHGNEVTVTVTNTQQTRILSAFGAGSFTVRASATARSIDGTGGGP